MSDRSEVTVPVLPGTYTTLRCDLGSESERRTLSVVIPHPMSADMAGLAASELTIIARMAAQWAHQPTEWSVAVSDDFVELYVPPAPGEELGTVLGLGEEETVDLIEALAQALAVIRAGRKASGG